MLCKSSSGDKRQKPLIVISVSSPDDFALDSSIGTYICTYDFTETALEKLVDVLSGDLTPTGSLPSSINRSRKIHQSKQHWPVDNWDTEGDAAALDSLIQTLQEETSAGRTSELAGCSSSTFLMHNSKVEESHFVVRNTSTGALNGFCSTYYFKSTGTGVLGAILVAPERRRLSIGSSLHARAIKSLQSKSGIKRLQLGSRLPSVYLGIPSDSHLECKRLRQWFANLGWHPVTSRSVYSMILRDIPAEISSPNGAESLQELDFELVQGKEYADSIMDHVKTNTRQGLIEVYALALAHPTACSIVRAKKPNEEAILGTVILYNINSGHQQWADATPWLKDSKRAIGGISSPVISPNTGDYSILLQCLILLGVRYLADQQVESVILDHV